MIGLRITSGLMSVKMVDSKSDDELERIREMLMHDENSPKYRIVKKYRLDNANQQVEYFIVEKLLVSYMSGVESWYYTNDTDAHGVGTYFATLDSAMEHVTAKMAKQVQLDALPADEVVWQSET